MEEKELSILGARLIFPKVHRDCRGCFVELYRASQYPDSGVSETFVQDNCSVSTRGALRGMHFQKGLDQAKLVTVLDGEIYDVIVDLRADSPTFGKWEAITLDSVTHTQLYIPAQCAHGFCVLSARACVMYKTSSYYDPHEERTFRYDDPQIGIEWPIKDPILSEKDLKAPLFSEVVLC